MRINYARSLLPVSSNCGIGYSGAANNNTSINNHLNKWLHLCVTKCYSSDTAINKLKIYLNGKEVYTTETAFKDEFINGPLSIGAEIGKADSKLFKGKLDDVDIWSRVLASCEISKLYYAMGTFITSDPKDVSSHKGI